MIGALAFQESKMTTSLRTFIDLYVRVLDTAAHILGKGAEHAAGLGVTEGEMLDWRLIEDMQPLRFQLMVVCNFTRQWPARAAGLPLPGEIGADLSVEQFQEEIANSKAWLTALAADAFEGREDEPLTVTLGTGMSPTLPAARWLTVFATTNVYFHLNMAYAILRSKGTQIGKVDLFPTGL
jgi:hypothetical protein